MPIISDLWRTQEMTVLSSDSIPRELYGGQDSRGPTCLGSVRKDGITAKAVGMKCRMLLERLYTTILINGTTEDRLSQLRVQERCSASFSNLSLQGVLFRSLGRVG